MGSVIVKHHKKAQILRKKEKEDKAAAEFFRHKRMEQEQMFKLKLDQQYQNDEQKIQNLKSKFKKMDERYTGHHNELNDYKEQMQESRT